MEFEKAFALEDDSEEPSGTNTPAIVDEKAAMAESETTSASADGDGGKGGEKQASAAARPPNELPPDVRSKLRKLDTLESKYKGKWPQSVTWLGLSFIQSFYDPTELHMPAP